jgi:hypothetical protein
MGPDAPTDSSKAAAPYMPLLFIRTLLRKVLTFNRASHFIA